MSMKFVILKKMIIEEWRLHSSWFGNKTFALFPVIIFIGSLIGSYFIPRLSTIMSIKQMFQATHFIFIFFGISIGSFGLLGKEIMNRRFGQASLIAYSSRSLPVSERRIFTNFLVKDIIYYFFLWIMPMTLGFILSTFFTEINTISSVFACFTLILSFLMGLSIVFFLSTLYAHYSKLLSALLLCILISIVVLTEIYSYAYYSFLLSFSFYYNPLLNRFFIISLLIIVPCLFSLVFIKVDYPQKKKHYKNSFKKYVKRFGFTVFSHYIAKDFLDLKRSEGGLGKIIFSFLLPVAFTWMFLYIFLELIPTLQVIMIFAIFLGLVSSSIYNMVTAFDTFNPYMFLPVQISTIIKSKIISYLLISIISFVILVIASISMSQIMFFIPALFTFITLSIFSLSMTIYFTGLQPTILMYNSKYFLQYVSSVSPVLFCFTIIGIVDPYMLLFSPILLLPSFFVIKKSFKKWNKWTPIGI